MAALKLPVIKPMSSQCSITIPPENVRKPRVSQLTFTSSKLTVEAPEKVVKYN